MNTMEISGEKKEQSSGLLNYFKSFDYHRTLPQDLSEASYFGAFSTKF